ncbi:outer membrane protein assembly factor BamC [Paraglaciecola sp. 2405UD69-4]|uniref:outer membrane protein assembly factor BamC n=1 Tax=Paraglaciecola sp. 2405UD69-4 TaxID=3391836 RepID=UPI0039C8C97E
MTYKYQITGVALVSILAACSSVEERELASGSFEYTQEQPGQRINIPEDIDSPTFSDSYKLPDIGAAAPRDTVGKDLSVLSPSLVLPVVAGSHIEEGSKIARVWFDQTNDNERLEVTIWKQLLSFIEEQGIGIQEMDEENFRLVTDWIVYDESTENSWYTWNGSQRVESKRFEFKIDKKPHGRTASLSANLVAYKEKKSPESPETFIPKDQRRYEVNVLNQVVAHYEFNSRVQNVKRFRQIRQGLKTELGFDADGEPAFIVDADYDIAWPRLQLVLKKLGFDVKDLDKSSGMLFTSYSDGESSWWSNIWSSESGDLPIEADEYRIKVLDVGSKTSITFMDEESNPFPANKLTDLFGPFSENMSDDNLDI